jgi:hypothetical protein
MANSAIPDIKHRALAAFAARSVGCEDHVALALKQFPHDGALLLADASLGAELGKVDPFARIEDLLALDTAWVDGHRALAQLKIAFAIGDPLELIERSLRAKWDNPQLWHCYLSLLSSLDRNGEAMEVTAKLRKRVGNVPALCLLEARFAGLAGDPHYGATLLHGLPPTLPDLDYQRLRNALQRGSLEEAAKLTNHAELGQDMRLWALAELTWRATGDPRHAWLLQNGMLVQTADVALSERKLSVLSDLLRSLHHTKVAPPAQSLRNGTQTRGQLHLRTEPALTLLFASFDRALANYTMALHNVPQDHPLFRDPAAQLSIMASWSVRLVEGGFHVPHIHSEGLVSSAFYLVVPELAGQNGGVLELGRPPSDIRLQLDPIMEIEPKPGRLALFPSFLYHSTGLFRSGERLTAVFDAA